MDIAKKLETFVRDLYAAISSAHEMGSAEGSHPAAPMGDKWVIDCDEHVDDMGSEPSPKLGLRRPLGRIVYTVTVSARWEAFDEDD